MQMVQEERQELFSFRSLTRTVCELYCSQAPTCPPNRSVSVNTPVQDRSVQLIDEEEGDMSRLEGKRLV